MTTVELSTAAVLRSDAQSAELVKDEDDLFVATESGSIIEISRLVEKGEDLRRLNEKGQSVLHITAQRGDLNIVHFSVVKGLDVDQADLAERSTPLHWAVVNDKIEVVRYLLGCGADPLKQTRKGVNAIHLAAGLGYDDILLALLEKCNGTQWQSVDQQGRDPIQVALQNKFNGIARFLRKYRKVDNSLSPIGWTLLGPLLISLLAASPTHPWLALGAVLCLVLFTRTPWSSAVLSLSKSYYFFLGLVYFSLMIDLKHAHEFYGVTPFFIFRVCLTLTASLFYGLAIFSDAGIHKVNKSRDNQEFLAQIQSGDDSIKICHTCRVRRPARAKHCHQVDGCVHRFDHFCIWVCNAVGAGNHLYFMLFIFFILPVQFFVAVMHSQMIINIMSMDLSAWDSMATLWSTPLVPFLTVFAVIGLWQIPLLISQLHGIAVGMTAHEKMLFNRKRKAHECTGGACHTVHYQRKSVAENFKEFLFYRRTMSVVSPNKKSLT